MLYDLYSKLLAPLIYMLTNAYNLTKTELSHFQRSIWLETSSKYVGCFRVEEVSTEKHDFLIMLSFF
jgi:hypothetical protein